MAQGRFWLGEERDVMNVVRWFESRFQFVDSFAEAPVIRSFFGSRAGGDSAPVLDDGAPELLSTKLSANAAEAPNFVLPNDDEGEPTGQLLFGPIKSYNYFAKPIDSGDVHSETLSVGFAGALGFAGLPGLQGMKNLEGAFGADSAPMGGLLDGPPADILGAPPVI